MNYIISLFIGDRKTRVCITAFAGWGNCGDEGILLSIMDSLGDNEYIVCTNLPFNMLNGYKDRIQGSVEEVRQIYDVRSDYDIFLLGGGALSWGFGWRQALTAFSQDKLSMNYGVGYNTHQIYHARLIGLYREFLKQFDAITVRDEHSQVIANMLGVDSARLTGCPSMNLKEEKFDCPKNMIAVCPRYEDYGTNEAQLKWLTTRLADVADEVLLIPFAPYNTEGVAVDLDLCRELKAKLTHSQILETDGFSPRKVKYAISQSKLVISGGRYHALVWAATHNIPFEVCPTAIVNYPKTEAFQEMCTKYGTEKVVAMEKGNMQILARVMKNGNK